MTERSDYLSTPLETIDIRPRTIAELLEAMGRTGFQGKSLSRCLDVLVEMIQAPENTIFLGYAGSLSTTGQWKIIRWLVENRYVDVLVSTGANVSEDVFEALGFRYRQGSHLVDDADLLDKRIDRYYDVYADELEYRQMERFLGEFMATLEEDQPYSSAEFLHRFGLYQTERGVESITAAAANAGVPVFSPGLADSGFGVAAFLAARDGGPRVVLDQLEDFRQLGELGGRAETTSVVYLGGGVPKDTIQLVTVMADLAAGGEEARPHSYAVQVTTDSPQWGGLSGCTFEEAISWGKIAEHGGRAVCYCDVTIALPLLAHGLLERGVRRADAPAFDWLLSGVI